MERESACPKRLHILGWPVDLFDKAGLLEFMDCRISSGRKTVLANLNLHALYCLQKSGAMRSLLARSSTFVHIDGMPIVWLLKMRGKGGSRDNRLTHLDWGSDALELAAKKNWKVAYIGSTPETCAAGVRYFQRKIPNLELKGWDGFFDVTEETVGSKLHRLKQEVNAFRPDLLFVGMGMPRQEHFLELHGPELQFKVAICAGAFLEYFAGEQSPPPRWLGRVGFEWLYRLVLNPRRYGRRYLIEPLALLLLIVGNRVGRSPRVQKAAHDSFD
jgi:N-acetylglucosaminyldiphosphoundecaprenol N-acetyl-beta-D-mannosaminyltransferase